MTRSIGLVLIALALAAAGCRSPYASDRLGATGAVLGGVTGAVVGKQLGHTAGGALVGAAAGGLAGLAVGDAIDETEARNRAEIASRIGREPPPGAVSIDDIVAMQRAGVPESVISSHVSNRGMARPVQSEDLIYMQQQGIPASVMQAAQRSPPKPAPVVYSAPPPTTVIVEEHYDPWCHYPHYHHRHYYGPPRVGFGFSYHD
ncbi:MAG: hypothetical protein HYS13_03200 [Planctomycetia bacterium]|nr:hypothetical protein [Planctomycetia bacterium]